MTDKARTSNMTNTPATSTTPVTPPIDFSRPADEVAPLLLGAILRVGPVAVELTEVEAYLGELDAASHAAKGPTPRASVMFGPPQRLYVYVSYGIHRAGNIVCSPNGTASAVLLRGGRVVMGEDIAMQRRLATRGGTRADMSPDTRSAIASEILARGPGNLGAALGLDLHLNGQPFSQGSGTGLAGGVELTPAPRRVDYVTGPRIGISKNTDAQLRFWIPGDPTVSSPRGRTARGRA